MKKRNAWVIGVLWLLTAAVLQADNIKLKVTLFKCQKPGGEGTVVSDYALKPSVLAYLKTAFPVDMQMEEIKKVFNIQDLGMVSEECVWLWKPRVEVKSQIQINGTSLVIGFTQLDSGSQVNRIGIRIQDAKRPGSAPEFETEITLPKDQIAIAGFTGHDQVKYFLSFYNLVGVLSGPDIAKLPAPLKKIRDVSVVYPRVALDARIQEIVTVEAVVNEQGDVIDFNIVKGHPLLNSTAIDTVKQWKFEPYLVDGKPTKASFVIKIVFKIN